MFDTTQFLQETITGLNETIIDSLLTSQSFELEVGTAAWGIFIICLVWQTINILIDFADKGSPDYKKIINTICAIVIVNCAYGKINPRGIPGLDFGLAGTEYDYKGKKTLFRDTHAVFRKFFNEFAEGIVGDKDVKASGVTETLVNWTQKRSYVQTICDGVNNEQECVKKNLERPIPELKEEYYSDKCGFGSTPLCEPIAWVKATFLSVTGVGSVFTSVLDIVKMVLIIIVFVGYTIITILSLVMLKIIFPFIILDKTRSSVISGVKFYLSTSAFVFVIKIFRFIVASATLGVLNAVDALSFTDLESFAAKSIIGAMLILAVVVIEVGMLFATPKLTAALFNLNLEVFTNITDELKNSVLMIGSVVTGGAALAGVSKLMGTGVAKNALNKAKGKFGGGAPTGGTYGGGASGGGPVSNFNRGQSNSSFGRNNINQGTSSRIPFSGQEPESIVDNSQLNADSSEKQNKNKSETNKKSLNTNKPNINIRDEKTSDAPESVLDKDTDWQSMDIGNNDSNNFSGDVNNNIPSSSDSTSGSSFEENENNNEFYQDDEDSENNNESKITKLSKKAGALLYGSGKGLFGLTASSLKMATKLTVSAVDAGKGDKGSIKELGETALAGPKVVANKVAARSIIKNHSNLLNSSEKQLLSDYLNINIEQDKSDVQKVERFVQNWNGLKNEREEKVIKSTGKDIVSDSKSLLKEREHNLLQEYLKEESQLEREEIEEARKFILDWEKTREEREEKSLPKDDILNNELDSKKDKDGKDE